MSDVQARYGRIADGFDAAVGAVGNDRWDALSPCEGWKARDIVAHVVDGHRHVVAGALGAPPQPAAAADDLARTWRQARAALDEVLADPGAMAKQVEGPTGPMSAEQIIGRFVCMDLLVHTWDLARTVGADETLDEDSVRHAYEALKPMDAMIRRPGVFGARLEAPDDADLQTEFLYFLGRRA